MALVVWCLYLSNKRVEKMGTFHWKVCRTARQLCVQFAFVCRSAKVNQMHSIMIYILHSVHNCAFMCTVCDCCTDWKSRANYCRYNRDKLNCRMEVKYFSAFFSTQNDRWLYVRNDLDRIADFIAIVFRFALFNLNTNISK